MGSKGGVMRDIRATAEVRALIGADKLREQHEDARERYECWQCGRTGRTTEPHISNRARLPGFRGGRARACRCADPQIIEVDAAGMRTVAGQIPAPQHRQRAGEAASPRRNSPGLAWAGRWLLDRRRLADWEVAWASVGQQWTKRFRSRG